MVTFLLSYFINPPGPGTIRVQLSTLDSSYYTEYIPPVVNGKRLLNIPVYILISRATASAAESFTTNMSFFNKNVTTIGEKTRGAENPIDYTFIDENFILQIPSYKILYSLNPYSWEGKGIEPDIAVEAANAKEYAHKLMLKELFRDCKDSLSKSKYQWALDGLEASYDNVEIRLLKELTGSYGKYEVYLEDGEIYILYNAGPARKLIPINEKYFIVDGIQYYRIEFLNDEHGQRMKRIFYYGNVQEISKEK